MIHSDCCLLASMQNAHCRSAVTVALGPAKPRETWQNLVKSSKHEILSCWLYPFMAWRVILACKLHSALPGAHQRSDTPPSWLWYVANNCCFKIRCLRLSENLWQENLPASDHRKSMSAFFPFNNNTLSFLILHSFKFILKGQTPPVQLFQQKKVVGLVRSSLLPRSAYCLAMNATRAKGWTCFVLIFYYSTKECFDSH